MEDMIVKLGVIGQGTYGKVHMAVYRDSDQKLAVKSSVSSQSSSLRREEAIFQYLGACPDIVNLTGLMKKRRGKLWEFEARHYARMIIRGCTMIEMVTGERVWGKKTANEIFDHVVIKRETPQIPEYLSECSKIGRVRYDPAESYPPRSGLRRVRYQIPRLDLNRLDSDESTDIPKARLKNPPLPESIIFIFGAVPGGRRRRGQTSSWCCCVGVVAVLGKKKKIEAKRGVAGEEEETEGRGLGQPGQGVRAAWAGGMTVGNKLIYEFI
ncbi:hypothetical protein CK203_052803 [Vitis vinifera]|uniref:Protein kinase domain-containing protein n=1 Tax=Vitis vinifera TaxID=29760 RepID=A0A438GUX8_VITVI|nr:hypothetical protein CK203_052803 [Vitis vinifera]